MQQLKRLSRDAVPAALEKVERYRLLNEPSAAESICLDVLEVEPNNQAALVMLILALTDQFPEGIGNRATRVKQLIPSLEGDYERAYYEGILHERRGRAELRSDRPGTGVVAYEWFRSAMACYERAEPLRPPGNDEVLLRWNACARDLERCPAPQETADEQEPQLLE